MAVTSSYFGHGPSGWYVADELWPGMAYWVKTDGAGELVICSDAGQEPREETVRIPDLKRLSSLRIEDASGRSQSLYLGTGEEIPGPMLDLPPRPPAKSFDLRFSSGGMAAALPAEVGDQPELAEQVILLQGVTLPLNLSWTFQPGVELDLYGNHRGTPPGDPPGTPLGGRAKIATLTGTGSVVITSGGGSSDLVSSLGLRRTQESTLPAGFSIAQNFPNPFNPLTTIVYELPIASRVAIRVYDVLGKEVGVLVDETKDAGRHSVSWDGSAMPSGVYYCRMTAGSFSDGRKLLLIR
jgi:hypothetical protein